jgi:hypothetical protein
MGLRPSRSWNSDDKLQFAAISPSDQDQQRPVSHANKRIVFDDFTQSTESRHASRDRSTQNNPSIWDRLTTGASCAGRFILGKLPKHRWP